MRGILVVFVIATASLTALGQPAVSPPLPEDSNASIGYPTVEAALTALRAKPGVQIQEQNGWIIVSDKESGNPVLWSFTPSGYPAHPSAVKRSFIQKASGSDLEMKVLCEADKTSCDALVREFQALNDRALGQVQHKAQQSRPAAQPSTDRGPEEINITPDSAPGWLPSADQRARVRQFIENFLAALDSGQYAKAYDLETPGQKELETLAAFTKRVTDFNTQAGPVKERRITKITWTKDPAHAPAAGIYAAVDLVSRFANVDRHCGYIVLYQGDALAPFQVMRQEDGYMTDDQARQIEKKQSRQAVDQLWAQVARNCPNYSPAGMASKSE